MNTHPGIQPIPQNWKISKDGLGNLHIYEPATDTAEFRINLNGKSTPMAGRGSGE